MLEHLWKECEFPVKVGLHQGSALSLYLFALVTDGLAWHVQEVSWCIIANNIILIDKTR